MARRRGRFAGAVPPYGPLAGVYDIIHARKPYAREAQIVRRLAARYASRRCRTLLDVACGSGRHLEEFVRWFDCTGVDASPSMLARARSRVPRATLVRGRMESFALRRRFDIVTCLFSAIGYVRSRRELDRTVRNFARHTAPGGVVVVEPWLAPSEFLDRSVHTLLRESDGLTVVRMNGSRLRRGRSIMDFHFLLGRYGVVQHQVEVHDCALFDPPTMRAAFVRAGPSVRRIRPGFPDRRTLYVGLRPLRVAPKRPRATGRP